MIQHIRKQASKVLGYHLAMHIFVEYIRTPKQYELGISVGQFQGMITCPIISVSVCSS